jgi:hypothetical protein
VLRDSDLLPPGVEVKQRSEIEFSWRAPGMPEALRVTTDLDFYENSFVERGVLVGGESTVSFR